MENNYLGTERIEKLFITIVLPSMLAMVIMGIQGMIDGLFIGNYVGSNAMASINIAMPFLQGSSAIGMIIGIGSTAFIGRLLGAGDVKTARIVFKTSLLTLIVSGILLLMIAQCYGVEIARGLGADDVLLEETQLYIKVVSYFIPALLMYYLFSFVNRIVGKAHLFLIGTMAGITANIILNYIFIVQLNWGIRGAALATGVSQLLGFLINFPPVLDKSTEVNVYQGSFNWKILGEIVYNGSSEGVTSIATGVTTFVFNITFMAYYGAVGVSAFTIISYVAQVANLLIFGVVDGVSPIISFNFGARFLERVKKVVCIAMILNLVIGIVTYFIIVLLGERLIGMFANGDSNLIELTYHGAKLYALIFFICGINILASSYFTAIGDALKSIVVSASRGLIFILVGIGILPRLIGVEGVWLVAPFADMVTLIIVGIILKYKSSFLDKEEEGTIK